MAISATSASDDSLLPLRGIKEKRTAVEALIKDYAINHAKMDVAIGLAGFLPIPGAGIVATVGAVAAQAPLIYKPLARDIAEIYSRSPDGTARRAVLGGAVSGGLADIAVDLGVEFFSEIAIELLQEIGAGVLVAGVPILGGFAGVALDIKIAWTMTWRVGMMVAIYHENGSKWIVSRKHTYEAVRKSIKVGTGKDGRTIKVARIVDSVPEVKQNQVGSISVMADVLLSGGISKSQAAAMLSSQGFSPDLIESALAGR